MLAWGVALGTHQLENGNACTVLTTSSDQRLSCSIALSIHSSPILTSEVSNVRRSHGVAREVESMIKYR